jgi:hypothetical protein
MERHCLRAVVEGIGLNKRHFGQGTKRFEPRHLVVNRALEERHRNALWRTLGEKRH